MNAGDTEDGTETISTNLVTTISSPALDFPAPGDTYPTFRIRILAFTRKDGDAGTLQNCWTGSEPTDVVNATSGAAVYITPDITKAAINAGDIDITTLGDRLGITAGKLGVRTDLAPNPVSVTAVINSTSASTLAAILLLPVWNAVLTITLNTGSALYVRTKQLRIEIPGYSPFAVTSWTLSGSVTTITIPTEYQDSLSHTPTLSVFAINDDGAPSALAATVVITVPAASTPFSGIAPLAPSFAAVTATATPIFIPNGHLFSVGFVVLFTARGGNAALCKCKRCGHTYISSSMAAKRAMRRLSNKATTVG